MGNVCVNVIINSTWNNNNKAQLSLRNLFREKQCLWLCEGRVDSNSESSYWKFVLFLWLLSLNARALGFAHFWQLIVNAYQQHDIGCTEDQPLKLCKTEVSINRLTVAVLSWQKIVLVEGEIVCMWTWPLPASFRVESCCSTLEMKAGASSLWWWWRAATWRPRRRQRRPTAGKGWKRMKLFKYRVWPWFYYCFVWLSLSVTTFPPWLFLKWGLHYNP